MVTPHLYKHENRLICKKVILHHSWKFIQENIKPYLNDVQEVCDEDYPFLIGKYKNERIACICTRMGVEESVNIVDQLISTGAKIFIKLGSFVALNDSINIGDIHIPKEAVRLPGIIDAIIPEKEKILADKELINVIKKTAHENNINIKISKKILTCPLYGFYIRDESINKKYTINYWKDECFGDEMECSGIFAVTNSRRVKSAAILLCNRTWQVLDGHRKKIEVDWYEHKNSKSEIYKKACQNAVVLALESIVKV